MEVVEGHPDFKKYELRSEPALQIPGLEIPLPVRAAEEKETYTVTFEAFEGTCETENVSVPKGESIILPDASCEGHYLYGWVDVVEEEGTTVLYEIPHILLSWYTSILCASLSVQ